MQLKPESFAIQNTGKKYCHITDWGGIVSNLGWMQNRIWIYINIMMFYFTVKQFEVHIKTRAQTKLNRP